MIPSSQTLYKKNPQVRTRLNSAWNVKPSQVQTEEEKSKLVLEDLVEQAPTVLYKVKSIFPFDFFPDEIVIDTHKLNIINRIFFFSDSVASIPYSSIGDVQLETSIFFASLKVVTTALTRNLVTIRYLSKSKATRARRIILGLMVMEKEGVDLKKIDPKEIMKEVERIGAAHTPV